MLVTGDHLVPQSNNGDLFDAMQGKKGLLQSPDAPHQREKVGVWAKENFSKTIDKEKPQRSARCNGVY